MLKRFFAVTVSGSLYEISDKTNERNWPTVRKVSGPTNPNMQTGTCLRNGKLVGISDLGICLFDPTPREGRNFELMNTSYWGGSTSGIVALFLERSSAEACITSSERTLLSEKYMDCTRSTLQNIGNDHPVFVIGNSVKEACSLELLNSLG